MPLAILAITVTKSSGGPPTPPITLRAHVISARRAAPCTPEPPQPLTHTPSMAWAPPGTSWGPQAPGAAASPTRSPRAVAKAPTSHMPPGRSQGWCSAKRLAPCLNSQGISLGKICFLVFLPFQWLPKHSQPPMQAQTKPGLPGGRPSAQGTAIPKAGGPAQPGTRLRAGLGRSRFGPQPRRGHAAAPRHIPQPCPRAPSSWQPPKPFRGSLGVWRIPSPEQAGEGAGLAGLRGGCACASGEPTAITALAAWLYDPVVTSLLRSCSRGEKNGCVKGDDALAHETETESAGQARGV